VAFTPKWTAEAKAKYDELKKDAKSAKDARKKNKQSKASHAEGLFRQVSGCVQKLLNNPRHPSLNTHKYDSLENPYDSKQPVFEAYAQNQTPGAYRVFWCYGAAAQEITIIAITPHP
jgi:hypothetical protein